MSEKPKTYCVEVKCLNCEKFQHDSEGTIGFEIPFGNPTGIFLNDKLCKNCGCPTLTMSHCAPGRVIDKS